MLNLYIRLAKSICSIGSSLDKLCPQALEQLKQQIECSRGHYLLLDSTSNKIHLLFHQKAAQTEVLTGLLHGITVYQTMESADRDLSSFDLIESTRTVVEREAPHMIEQLSDLGWDTTNPFIEVNRKRIVTS